MDNEDISGLENILLEERDEDNEFVIRRIVHDEWDIPEVDYSNFKTSKRVPTDYLFKSAVDAIITYLHKPSIIDHFTDERKRNEWENGMHERHGREMYDFLQNNALSGNNISALENFIGFLRDGYVGGNHEFKVLAGRIIEGIHQLRTEVKPDVLAYDLLVNGEKRKYVKDLKDDVYSLLKMVAKK